MYVYIRISLSDQIHEESTKQMKGAITQKSSVTSYPCIYLCFSQY